jgi:hypothetical protein
MYYIGIFNEQNNFYFFAASMHRKTAKRVYEPFIYEKFENTDAEQLKKIITSFHTSKDLTVMKKKFSQSGRPPRKILVQPQFIFAENKEIEKIAEELRVSKTKIVLNNQNNCFNDFEIELSKEKIIFLVEKTYKEKRIIFEKFKSDFDLENELKDLNSKDYESLNPFVKAFALIVSANESGKIKIKRY